MNYRPKTYETSTEIMGEIQMTFDRTQMIAHEKRIF